MKGWVRSGGAAGADTAFKDGAQERTIVYIPWRGFVNLGYARILVSLDDLAEDVKHRAYSSVRKYHPAPERLSAGGFKLMARNYLQVFGAKSDSKPTDCIVYWTPKGKEGGTGQTLRIARDHKIPCIRISRGMELKEIIAAVTAAVKDRP